MMEQLAGMAMSMSAAATAQSYSIAITKKTMESQELAAQELLKMLPDTPAPAKGLSLIHI